MGRREAGNREIRNTFYIITNGEKTEKTYFELIKQYKSIYDVKVQYHNGDPYKLVEYARTLNTDNGQVWCVFDVDSTGKEGRIEEAVKLASKKNIKYVYSNLAFEVWLLSNCGQYDKEQDCKGLIADLNSLLKAEGKTYEKNDEKLLEEFFIPKYKEAVHNSKIVYQKKVMELGEPTILNDKTLSKFNSCTTVFKLIEALKLSAQDDNEEL